MKRLTESFSLQQVRSDCSNLKKGVLLLSCVPSGEFRFLPESDELLVNIELFPGSG